MFSQKSKQKKPFLKKGTRQFLSNAQVRSQSSKPRIVDFGADQQQFVPSPNTILKTRSSQNVDPNYNDIKIKVNPTSAKLDPTSKNQQQLPAKKVDRPPVSRNIQPTSSNKPKKQVSKGKKKQAALSDYLDNQSANHNDYPIRKPTITKPQPIYKKPQPKKSQQQKKPIQKQFQHTQLVQQQLDQQQQTPNFIQNDSFKPISNPYKNRESNPAAHLTKISNLKQTKKNIYYDQDNICGQQVNFYSDKSDDQQYSPVRKNIPVNITNKNQTRQQYRQQQQNLSQNQNQPVVSKVKMNYFNKGSQEKNKQPAVIIQQNKQKNSKKPLALNDISKQLKQQIVKETIAEKQKQLHQQLQKLRDKFASIKKQKQKLQQQQKAFIKARQQFQKQIEERNKQFEQKIKSQNMKLMREKKYMKDAQMSGQGDRKFKTQLQEVRKQLERQKQQKKKIQTKYKLQAENLRKKLAEEASKNKLLSEQIKLLQYGQLAHKQQLQQITKQQKKNSIQGFKGEIWADAPQFTYLKRFMEQEFSLIEMELERYHYEQNQYFQYYLKNKDTYSPLQSENADPDRVKRQYKNGKVQIQHYKKFVKEVFPYNYTVVNLWNGDIKQTLPQGIMVYYSQNSGATQYCLKIGPVQKQIVYFPNNQTVQMKVLKKNDPSESYNQVLWRGQLKRILSDGTVTLLKKDPKGKIISL